VLGGRSDAAFLIRLSTSVIAGWSLAYLLALSGVIQRDYSGCVRPYVGDLFQINGDVALGHFCLLWRVVVLTVGQSVYPWMSRLLRYLFIAYFW